MKAPKIPSLFGLKSKSPDQFYFEPRYYNERKEKFKKRYDRISREVTSAPATEERNSEEFKSNLRENWGESYSRNRTGGKMNKRVLVYIIALTLIAYLILS